MGIRMVYNNNKHFSLADTCVERVRIKIVYVNLFQTEEIFNNASYNKVRMIHSI